PGAGWRRAWCQAVSRGLDDRRFPRFGDPEPRPAVAGWEVEAGAAAAASVITHVREGGILPEVQRLAVETDRLCHLQSRARSLDEDFEAVEVDLGGAATLNR